jgi:hypothetical protein
MQPPPPAVRVALGLLVADGLAALYLGELLGPLGLAIAGAGVVASYGGGWLRARLAARGWLGRLVVPAAAAASILDVMVLATIVLDALARLVCFLVVYKLFTLRTVRDSRVIGFLAFFMLVAASRRPTARWWGRRSGAGASPLSPAGPRWRPSSSPACSSSSSRASAWERCRSGRARAP